MSQPNEHPAAASPEQLWAECEVRRLRRSGPGGQHRNKVETAVSLRHLSTGVCAEAKTPQPSPEPLRRPLSASGESGPRSPLPLRLGPCAQRALAIACGRGLKVSATHEDFPALLAEALDVLAASDADPKHSAARLTCTPSQLVRLLKLDPRALRLVNQWRSERKLHRLR